MRSFRLFLLALLIAIPSLACATAQDRARIERVLRTHFDGWFAKDIGIMRDTTWPEGYLFSTVANLPGRQRTHWGAINFGGIGIYYRTRMARPALRIRGNRATARFRSTTRTYYSAEYSGYHATSRNRVELERRRGEWRVLDWYRASRSFSPTAAWRRRHPR